MEIRKLILLAEAEDPASIKPVIVTIEADASNLSLTMSKGEDTAAIFLWHSETGSLNARIQNWDEYRNDKGEEITLLMGSSEAKGTAEKPEAEIITPKSASEPEQEELSEEPVAEEEEIAF